MRKLALIFLMLIIISVSVTAIGISPARSYLHHEAGKTDTITLRILNDGTPGRAYLSAKGELEQYVKFSANLIVFEQGDQQYEVTYTIQHPAGLDPGLHETDIIALRMPEIDEAKGATVVATTAVISKLQVQVPYPGKYVRGRLIVNSALANEVVTFRIPVYNYGSEKVDATYAEIEIYGPTNELLGRTTTEKSSLTSKTEQTLVAQWLANVNTGRYLAKVTLYFDGQKVSFEEVFNVGDMLVRIKDIEADPFKLGDIAKFNIDVQSIWNMQLEGVFATVDVKDAQGNTINSFKSTSADLEPQEETTLLAFWDTKEMTEGRYDLKFVLHYGQKTTEKILQVLLTLNGIETDIVGTGQAISPEGSLLKRDSILVVLVILMVILNAFVIFKLLRRRGGP